MTEHELDKLLQEYGGAVRAVCRAILPGHPQDAEEAEADTFYKLWRGAGLPAATVRTRLHRARLALQKAIEGGLTYDRTGTLDERPPASFRAADGAGNCGTA